MMYTLISPAQFVWRVRELSSYAKDNYWLNVPDCNSLCVQSNVHIINDLRSTSLKANSHTSHCHTSHTLEANTSDPFGQRSVCLSELSLPLSLAKSDGNGDSVSAYVVWSGVKANTSPLSSQRQKKKKKNPPCFLAVVDAARCFFAVNTV